MKDDDRELIVRYIVATESLRELECKEDEEDYEPWNPETWAGYLGLCLDHGIRPPTHYRERLLLESGIDFDRHILPHATDPDIVRCAVEAEDVAMFGTTYSEYESWRRAGFSESELAG